MDIRVERLASVLADYSVAIQPGDRVAIMGEPPAAPLILALYERVLERGGHPLLQLNLPGIDEIFYRKASDEQLSFIEPVRKLVIDEFDALINVRSAANTRELTGIDPERQTQRAKAMEPIFQRYMARGASGDLKWVATLFPTHAYAQEADMSLRDYEAFVYGACFCDRDDPVSEWLKVHEKQAEVIAWLEGREEVVVKGPHADVSLSIKGRTFVNSDGHNNMPSGEIFTGPVENSVNGWVHFTYPAVTGGREVEGIQLWFEDGKVVRATAKKNEAYLQRMLETDEGARYLGEFAIGTNWGIQKFTKNILFDEKIGGSFHMAVGSGYPHTGSENRSAIHWDMICDMSEGGEIWVDGDLLYKNGHFQI